MYTILIADDEPEIRSSLSKYIHWESLGFRCIGTLADGKQVMEMLRTTVPDVILCDIRMPLANGLEVARYVHEHKLPCKVVLLSAYRDFEYAQKAIQYHVHSYMLKTARYSEIIDQMTMLHHELEDQNPFADASDPLLREIKAYIRYHMADASLEGAAQYLHRSASFLSGYFVKKIGTEFSEYLIQERMIHACKLLENASLHIYEISNMVGYTSSQNFTRAFRRYYGITPREFRTAYLGGEEEE